MAGCRHAAPRSSAARVGAGAAAPAHGPAVRIHHVELDLTVDFAARCVRGRARAHLVRLDRAAPLRLHVGPAIADLVAHGTDGVALTRHAGGGIELRPADQSVDLCWHAGPTSTALHWLPAELAGGRPFLQALGRGGAARDWLPLHDHPALRCTWTATVRTPPGSVALMPATRRALGAPGVTRFESSRRLATRDLALVVGDFATREAGPDCRVWAMPHRVAWGGRLGADLQAALWLVDARLGLSDWPRCDLVLLPALAGERVRSLPGLCLAAGPVAAPPAADDTRFPAPLPLALRQALVRTAVAQWSAERAPANSWRGAWLVESVDRYLTARLLPPALGARLATRAATVDHDRLVTLAASLPLADQVLAPPATDLPRAATPAEFAALKGAALLERCADWLGPLRWAGWFDDWCRGEARPPASLAGFRLMLEDELRRGAPARLPALAAWLERPGLPPDLPRTAPSAELRTAAAGLRLFLDDDDPSALLGLQLDAGLRVPLLGALATLQLPAPRLDRLDRALQFSSSEDPEQLVGWLACRLPAGQLPALQEQRLDQLLQSVGDRRLLTLLYAALAAAGPAGHQRARGALDAWGPRYHPAVRQAVARLLAKPLPTVARR